jgi:CheY-like chemotaxis protein/anti-sigma regulatory factor (Ser/Thr protein kinase)
MAARILLVEDSSIDQILVCRLLRNRWHDLQLEVCSSVAEAREAIEASPPDLILSDLHMPGATGMELIEDLRDRQVGIPVILLTGNGSEEIATRAIHAGAASYVPKRELTYTLLEAVDKILRLSRKHAAQRRMLGSMLHQDLRFCIENDLELVMPFVDYVREHLSAATPFTTSETTHICIALHESLTNAINHGNLELDSELRQVDESIYHSLGDQRRGQEPYASRRVYVALTVNANEVDFRIQDEGPGFNVDQVLSKLDEVSFDRIGGRGLLLIRSFMDTLSFNLTGNEIRFSKRAKSIAAKAACNGSELVAAM